MKTYLRAALFAVAIATLCACGAKGPLFMPEENAPAMEMPLEPVEAVPPVPGMAADADAVEGSEKPEEADPTPPE